MSTYGENGANTITITDPSGKSNGLTVHLNQAGADGLRIDSENAAHLNIRLANTAVHKNTSDRIQNAVNELGSMHDGAANFSDWTVETSTSWDSSENGAGVDREAVMSGGTPSETETAVFKIESGTSVTDNITVSVNGVDYTVGVVSGDTAEDVAAKIADKLSAQGVADYTVTNPSPEIVRFTSTIRHTNVTDINVSIK
ncbi:hypothetical protein [Salibacterium lacus]|uniref:Flagellin n=1 Tax=Salibacterium lacus TaxID=1898109 RepID=A0ABW5T641_9BACI